MTGADQRPVLTLAEVGQLLNLSKPTVLGLVHNGTIPAIRFGRSWRVPRVALERLLTQTGDTREGHDGH